MRKVQNSLLALGLLLSACALANTPREQGWDADWRFYRGDVSGADRSDFVDAGWRKVDLPHDWSIEDAPPRTNAEPTLSVAMEDWKFSRGDDAAWSVTGFDDSHWQSVRLPSSFRDAGYTNEHCFGWYRRSVVIPARLHGRDFLLSIGVVDDADETFFNGQKIGAIGGMPPNFSGEGQPWTRLRCYRVPASVVREGTNVVAVRVYNNVGDGGITGVQADFGVVGPFSPESAGGPATGYTVGGIGWYRKHFKLPDETAGSLVSVLFDGVYMDSDVWLNGHHLGNHPYGYTAFAYELTPYLNPPARDNVLAVRVRNLGKNSRWYSGSGIYRHVTLIETSPVHVGLWGISVTTPQVAKDRAVVRIATTVENAGADTSEATVQLSLLDHRGRVVKRGEVAGQVPAGGREEMSLPLEVGSPILWSPESPVLYQARVEVRANGKRADAAETTFGIRDIRFSSENGFTLNGGPVKLRGACLHHDNGPLGAAAFDRAEERRVELMKAQGFNAIRTSHNPPSKVFLDACDRLGLFVMDEAFDCWEKGKNPDDYSKHFKDWWQRDLEAMIRRDRNHPSVILWSIGNEIPQRADERGYVIAKNLSDEVRHLDPTRPVTEAICNFWDQPGRPWSDTAKAFTFLDVGGYNYEAWKYEADHQQFPQRIIVGTESYPATIFDYWNIVEKHPYAIGDFVWTGMDYLGEAGCGNARLDNDPGGWGRVWPWFNAFCGDLDLCGFKKPQSYYRDVVWRLNPLEMMVHRPLPPGRKEIMSDWGWPDELPGWTWPGYDGVPFSVTVYSRCDTVRLELNDREVATRKIGPSDKLTAKFEVPYAPGKLRAVGLQDGKVITTKVLRTVGPAARIRLTADHSAIRADRQSLAFVTLEITDAKGNRLPDTALPVRFTVSGAGELAAVGSGNPKLPESFRGPARTTSQGRCLAILRSNGKPGRIKLRAEAAGLEASETSVNAR